MPQQKAIAIAGEKFGSSVHHMPEAIRYRPAASANTTIPTHFALLSKSSCLMVFTYRFSLIGTISANYPITSRYLHMCICHAGAYLISQMKSAERDSAPPIRE
ncbi:MAG: hypothetical protein BGO12_06170 [Verrucomicrobia bacterium 61-8]|nr:MAG: hypothetical protein BGO12_06170 [Verrucomicrobia bacterium 61-8]